MNIINTKIDVGAEKPFGVIHMSDTHLTLADERDGERKITLADKRTKYFPEADAVLEAADGLAGKTGYTIIHTGDLIDFVSEKNLDAARKFTSVNDVFTAAGNHEFSLFVGEEWEDEAYRNRSLARVNAAFSNDIRFSSRIINGVNFVAVDNSYYLFEEWQLKALTEEVRKGLPVILCMHTPLYTEEAFDMLSHSDGKGHTSPAYLMAVPDEKMHGYETYRYVQQRADYITYKAYDYIASQDTIKALLVGHVHKSFELPFYGRTQYCVGCADLRILEIE